MYIYILVWFSPTNLKTLKAGAGAGALREFCPPPRQSGFPLFHEFHTCSVLMERKKDYYEVLGIPKASSQADIKKAYYSVSFWIILILLTFLLSIPF